MMGDTRSLAGKVAMVTGSGRGMGRAHAVELAKRGAAVVVHDVLAEEAEETMRQVRAAGAKAHLERADVTDPAAIREAVARAAQALGPIDILVNNAGIPAERTGIEEVTEEIYTRLMAVHVKGTFFTTQAVVPAMKTKGGGKIINVSSMWAQSGHHYGAVYTAAKAAILGLTKSWAKELAPWKITVNAITPGGVVTEPVLKKGGMEYVKKASEAVPLKRYAMPEEIAYAIGFLASPESDFVTGQVLALNGGQVIVGF